MITILALLLTAPDDWPTWRHDVQRSGVSPAPLPAELKLHWVRELPPLQPAWGDQPRALFDAVHEPIVAGRRLFLASPVHDRLTAYDTRTGAELWRFHADGPIRFAPAVKHGAVYVVSDDGHLSCVDAETGAPRWRFRAGPSDRRVLGHERLISTWPARGAPVLVGDTVYFAAGIWPFMGIFLYALDAHTGKVQWVNDGDGPMYVLQPHNTEAFAGVAPQGYLAAAGDVLLVPGGRSVAAGYDRHTGKLLHYRLAENARRGGFDLRVSGNFYFNGGFCFDVGTGVYLGEFGRHGADVADGWLYSGKKSGLMRCSIPNVRMGQYKDKQNKVYMRSYFEPVPKEDVAIDGVVEDLITAGSRAYVAFKGRVAVLEAYREVAALEVEGTPGRLIAADDRLYVSTLEGRLYCFGPGAAEPATHELKPPAARAPDSWTERAKAVLDATGVREGYAIAYGAGPLAREIARQSELRVVVLEADPARAETMRDLERVQVRPPGPLPPYFASLIVAEEAVKPDFAALRPFGGVAVLPGKVDVDLPGAEIQERDGLFFVRRAGAPPGAGNWTHEHADAANTRVSPDTLVRAPLGLLWFGGSTHEGILPRHGHGPQPQVVDGRLLIEGVNLLRALDIYTGRVLWESTLPGLGAFYNNTAHQPGANASGSNLVSLPDGIYLAYDRKGLRLDPATGKVLAEFKLPGDAPWGWLTVVGDTLLVAAEPLGYERALPKADPLVGNDDPLASPEALLAKIVKVKIESDTRSSSRKLVALDRISGKVLWTAEATHGWRHNAICAGGGRLYAIDRLSGNQVAQLKKDKKEPGAPPRLVAFDLATGKELWSDDEDVFGTWLSWSAEHDVLVEAGRVARDSMSDEPKGMRARKGADGIELWFVKNHAGPAMIRGREIHMAGNACDLLTGQVKTRAHPITGETTPWTWVRNYGCNTPMMSMNLLTFRSGAAGFFDLAGDGGTGNFGGFRSSCTNNLVVGGGILTVPDYTRTCTCGYQNQTSLALVPMPEAEMWTFFGTSELKGPIRRVGVNFGAPGDRKSDTGTLWIEHPNAGGKSPSAPVALEGKPDYFRRHSGFVQGPLPWVAASGVTGVREITLTLDKEAKASTSYTVRLVFLEPEERPARVFSVSLQWREVLKDFDVLREAGGPMRSVVKEFRGIQAAKDLKIAFTGDAILSGVEVERE
ncbi:MAG TPA: PQQ-binding-like beta-propeller repeat protein [Planctomycetota bacterium]